MRYPVNLMDISLPANLAKSADNHLALSQAHRAQGTSSVDDINHADQNTRRKARRQSGPGIRVTLQSLNNEPQISEYRSLKFDGHRKGSSRVEVDNVIELNKFDDGKSRSVNPRSKMILDDFIRQMGGAELSRTQTSGHHINTSV